MDLIQEISLEIQPLLDRLRGNLSERRYMHVMGVTHTINALAERHGLCSWRSTLAALLHDLSKEMKTEKMRKQLQAWGTDIPADDLESPKTWHGFHAAEVARRELGITDGEILEAVALHTTADAEISPITRAIFVADMTEPHRKIEEAPAVRETAMRDLDEGFREALRLKVAFMLAKPKFHLNPRAARAVHKWIPNDPLAQMLK